MRILFDANVLIAAFAVKGACNRLFDDCLGRHTICLSEEILRDVVEKVRDKFGQPPSRVDQVERLLRSRSVLVDPEFVSPDACRDPDDAVVLGAALAERVDCVVTGDKDLLVLTEFQGIPIVRPADFSRLAEGT